MKNLHFGEPRGRPTQTSRDPPSVRPDGRTAGRTDGRPDGQLAAFGARIPIARGEKTYAAGVPPPALILPWSKF